MKLSAHFMTYETADGKKHRIPRLWDPDRQRTSAANSKTGIISISFLAGAGAYAGYIPAVLKKLMPSLTGTCNCNCPGCYAKVMTRLPETYVKFYLNTIEMRLDPARFLALCEKEIYTGNVLTAPRVVRFHDSGDIDNAEYLKEMLAFIARHPETRFGTYTKRDDIVTPEIIETLPTNLTLSCSPWKDISKPIGNLPQFIYDDGTDPEIAKLPHCPAVDKNGKRTKVKCCQCLHCYTAEPGARWAVYEHGTNKGKKERKTRK